MMNVYDAHMALMDSIIDADSCEAFDLGNTNDERAAIMAARADHIRDVLDAMINYVTLIVTDTERQTGVRVDVTGALPGLRDEAQDLVGSIGRAAVHIGEVPPPRFIDATEIRQLINQHIEELVPMTHSQVMTWALNHRQSHSIRSSYMPTFWREFTAALFQRELKRGLGAT